MFEFANFAIIKARRKSLFYDPKRTKSDIASLRLSDATRFVEWFNDPEFNKFMFLRRMTMRKEVEWIKTI